MARYGEVATLAARTSRRGVHPVQAWNTAAARIYGDQRASRDKSWPKSAFLGLAEEGLISGVQRGATLDPVTTNATPWKACGCSNRSQRCPPILMRCGGRVMAGERKQHNEQMEVVAALWVAGDIAGAD